MVSLGIDLSALSHGELQRLLTAARSRGEAALADRLQAELADRRAHPGRTHGIVQRLAAPAIHSQPPAAEPLSSPGRPIAVGVAVALALAVSGGLGWWATRPPSTPALQQPAPGPIEEPAHPAPAAAAPRQATSHTPAISASNPARAAVHHTPVRRAAPHRIPRHPSCAAARDASDRMVCRSPALLAEHRAMLRAYDQALAAGADRLRIDAAQARWRQARAHATSSAALLRLYRRRIAALEDAASSARRQRGH